MLYEDFVEAVERKLKEVTDDTISISIFIAEKNNGITRKGVIIKEDNLDISPTIYLEEYFEHFCHGCTIEMIVYDILQLYEEVRVQKNWDYETFDQFGMIADKIVFRLVNQEKNKELLQSVPYVQFMDLAVIFYLMMDITEKGTAAMLIRNEHMKKWGTDAEEIRKLAMENTEKLLPYEFYTMRAMLEELGADMSEVRNDIMYILTNKIRCYGAAALLYEGRLEQIGRFLGENYFVIPSSVHEVIIIGEKDAWGGKESLENMIRDVNDTEIDPEEILSYHAYYYDRSEGKLR